MANEKTLGLKAHWKCLLACVLVSMSPFQYGMDFSLIGSMQAMIGFLKVFGYRDPATPIGWNISTGTQQLISSLMTLGAFLGSLMAGPIAIKLGRRQSLWAAVLLCWASNSIMIGTTSLAGLYVGRLFIGIANGFFMTFSQLYLQECSPPRYRGLALTAFQVWTSLGTLIATTAHADGAAAYVGELGTIVDNYTAKRMDKLSYRIPLACVYIVPCIIAVGLVFIPESPRWLAGKGRMDEARKALKWLRPESQNTDKEFSEIMIAIDEERELARNTAVWDMFRHPVDRRRTMLAVGGVSVQAASGAMYMIAYGTYFFEMAGIGNAFQNSCILTGAGTAAIVVECFIIGPWGRRRVFLTTGLIVCAFCQLIIAIVYDKHPGTKSTGRAVVAISVIYILVYNAAIAPFAWLSGGELPSQRLRSYTFGLSAAIGFLGAWLATFTAPYFINPSSLNWGPKYGFIWFPSCLLAAAFIFFCLPEVKQRSLEEIDEMFQKKIPARKWRHYECEISKKAEKQGVLDIGVPGEKDVEVSLEKGVSEALVETIEHVHLR